MDTTPAAASVRIAAERTPGSFAMANMELRRDPPDCGGTFAFKRDSPAVGLFSTVNDSVRFGIF